MSLAIGETFAGYRILRILGAGGMGEVYLAQHPRLPRQDALKVLRPDATSDSSFRERFIREANLAAALWHPHIVGVHDRGEYEGQLWIAMDYVDGLDAAQLMQHRHPAGMPAQEVGDIVTEVASALDYAHKRGLLHRDVKPANILLAHFDADERRILLTDFGIARPVDDANGLTPTNMTVGTVAYAAPEQLMGEDIDGRADQYALAATTYYLLTGTSPYQHTNPAVVISKHLNAPPPLLGEINPELAALDPVLAAGLAKNPDERFRRCIEFAHALTEQIATHGSASPCAPTTPAPVYSGRRAPHKPTVKSPAPTLMRKRRSLRLVVAVSIGVVLLLGTFLAMIWSRHPQHPPPTPASGDTKATVPLPPPTISTSTTPRPRVFPMTAIDTLLLSVERFNDTLGTRTLEVKDSSFGASDNSADVTPAACVGVVHGAEQHVYQDTGFLQMRNQTVYPRPYTEAEATNLGRPWKGQQTVVVFPTEEQARSVLTSSEDRWRSCASEPVMEKGYEFTAPWELGNIQLREDVLTVSLADPSPVPGPNAGACQHALGVRANVLAEAVTCTANTRVAGNGSERIVFAILDKVNV